MRSLIFLLFGLFFLPADLISQNSKPEPIDGWIALRKKAEQNPIVDSMLNEKGLVVAFYTAEISKKGVLKSLTLNDEGPLNGKATEILTQLLQSSKWNPMLKKGKPKSTIFKFPFSISRNSKKAKFNDTIYRAQKNLYDSLAKLSSDTTADGLLTNSASQKIKAKYGLDLHEENARYAGGDAEFLNYIRNDFDYPARCLKANISGTVVVTFKINPYGKTSNIRLTESSKLCPEFGKEAIRVIEDSEFWIPAVSNGYYINAWRQIPLQMTFN